MLIGLCSAGGSPGVTTTVLAMGSVWPAPVVVIDADPSGGDVAAAGGGVIDASLSNVLELVRLGRGNLIPRVLDSQIQTMPFGTAVVVGFGDPSQVGAVSWPELAAGLRAVEHRDVLVDLGRWGIPFAPGPVLRACDVLVMVVRTQTRALRRAERVLPLIGRDLDRANPGNAGVELLVIDDNGSFSAADISRRLRAHVIGELPHDPKAAAVFSDAAPAPRHLDRSPLVKGLAAVVAACGQLAQQRRSVGSRASLLREPVVRSLRPGPHSGAQQPQAAPASALTIMARAPRRLRPVPPSDGDA